MRKPKINELATVMFAALIFFASVMAPDLFADGIATISLIVALIAISSLYIEAHNIRIVINIVGIAYITFITASYLLIYPLLLTLAVIMIIWLIHESFKLVDDGEEAKCKKILIESFERRRMKRNEKQ